MSYGRVKGAMVGFFEVPYNYLDIFEAADIEVTMKVSTIVRTFGHAHTEIWPATECQRFKEIVRGLFGVSGD